jgi:hypothetical protein
MNAASSTYIGATLPTASRLMSSKIKAEGPPLEQHSESSSKCSHIVEKNEDSRCSLSPQGQGRHNTRSGGTTGSTATSTPTNTGPFHPRTWYPTRSPTLAGVSPSTRRNTGASRLPPVGVVPEEVKVSYICHLPGLIFHHHHPLLPSSFLFPYHCHGPHPSYVFLLSFWYLRMNDDAHSCNHWCSIIQ